jgi:hypothetical protein
MLIGLIPLDSRPASWQFPQRIGAIASAEVVSPARELLGTLHRGGDQSALLNWLADTTQSADAAVLSWDALVYGGLVQSRAEGNPLPLDELRQALSTLDWQRCKGYLWLTIPRLGMTISTDAEWQQHKLIAEYFRLWGQASAEPGSNKLAAQLHELEARIGNERLAQAWWLRRRNLENARGALRLAADLGFRTCHVAMEDNARTGPHLDELAELRKLSLELTIEARREGREAPRFTFFDGTDECGSLLAARAILDHHDAPPLPVRLTLFPSVPTPDKYFGLYESHSLEDGLEFLAKFLGFEYRAEGKVQWLVCFGKQPQPDLFVSDPAQVLASPLLLPDTIRGIEPLFVADLQACNGGNPNLLHLLAARAGPRLKAISAWNTNFNALGFSAATLAVSSLDQSDALELKKLLIERIVDDYVYQSHVRGDIIDRCDEFDNCGVSPLDFNKPTNPERVEVDVTELTALLEQQMLKTLMWRFGPSLKQLQFHPDLPTNLRYSFPWQRAFEIEVST